MSLDKAKTLRAAEKYLEMGKIPAAIKEYCKIVESEPNDFTTLNVLGDLYVRVGNQSAAISCFQRIAEHYREQEFALKAIAMFKKIDRLKPNDVDIATNLADLYAQQDLMVEARAHYMMVADAHEKSGATQAGLEVLRKIADLDPQNTGVRIRLAEGYLNQGMAQEAAASFTEGGHSLLASGHLDEALEVFARSLDIEPANHETLNGVLVAHKMRGTADEAADIIGGVAAANPDDDALMSMLVKAHIEAENPQEAEKATVALVARDATTYPLLIEVAHLYLQTNQFEEALRVVAAVAERMLAANEEAQLIEVINELLSCDADNVQALRLLALAYARKRDLENWTNVLERLAESAQAAGLEKDERYALTQLVRLMPEHVDHLERLNQLGGLEDEEAIELLKQLKPTDSITSGPLAGEFVVESEKPSTDGSELEMSSVMSESSLEASEMEIERGDAFEGLADAQSSPHAEVNFAADGADNDRRATMRDQELESVDFYIEQGYMDIAVDSLDLLESQFGKHADIDRRRERVAMLAAGNSIEPAPQVSEAAHNESSHVAAEEVPTITAQIIDPGLAEVFEEYRVSAEGEFNGNGDYETHYNLGLAYKEMDLFEEALEEFQIAVSLVTPEDGTQRHLQCCNLIGHCFMQKGVPQLAVKWFQKGLNAPSASEEERQALRFELAAAYEQAGELNRAIDLFTEVYGVNVSYRGVNERLRSLQDRVAQ